MKVFKVITTQFDSLENRNPHYRTSKLFSSLRKAEKFVKEQKQKNKNYKGWDGETYPQYAIRQKVVI
jgi:hypothetical protein